MLTIPEAAQRVGRHPETVRRWIRSGKLRSRKIGTQHLIDEGELARFEDDDSKMLGLPESWRIMSNGKPQPNWVKLIRGARESH